MVFNQAQSNFIAEVTAYYQGKGSWAGIADYMRRRSALPNAANTVPQDVPPQNQPRPQNLPPPGQPPQTQTGFVFVNLVDFDMSYGHRRDSAGYARALEDFDKFLPRLTQQMSSRDLLMITADHGCDPTFSGHTDHTREYVPILVWTPSISEGVDLGIRQTFADVGATVADALGVSWTGPGTSMLV